MKKIISIMAIVITVIAIAAIGRFGDEFCASKRITDENWCGYNGDVTYTRKIDGRVVEEYQVAEMGSREKIG